MKAYQASDRGGKLLLELKVTGLNEKEKQLLCWKVICIYDSIDKILMKALGILIGKGEDEKGTERISNLFDECPYNILNKAENKFLTLIFYIPEDHVWWLEEIKENPEKTLGLKEADVFFTDRFDNLSNINFQKNLDISPCGTAWNVIFMKVGV